MTSPPMSSANSGYGRCWREPPLVSPSWYFVPCVGTLKKDVWTPCQPIIWYFVPCVGTLKKDGWTPCQPTIRYFVSCVGTLKKERWTPIANQGADCQPGPLLASPSPYSAFLSKPTLDDDKVGGPILPTGGVTAGLFCAELPAHPFGVAPELGVRRQRLNVWTRCSYMLDRGGPAKPLLPSWLLACNILRRARWMKGHPLTRMACSAWLALSTRAW